MPQKLHFSPRLFKKPEGLFRLRFELTTYQMIACCLKNQANVSAKGDLDSTIWLRISNAYSLYHDLTTYSVVNQTYDRTEKNAEKVVISPACKQVASRNCVRRMGREKLLFLSPYFSRAGGIAAKIFTQYPAFQLLLFFIQFQFTHLHTTGNKHQPTTFGF